MLADGKVFKRKKTAVRKHTLQPVWNEPMNFVISPKQLRTCYLHLIIMDYDLLSPDDEMGSVGE
jgi:Ca2+-dependent lipid-binding protein